MTSKNVSGFTIVEMLISIVVTALFIELLFQFADFYLSASSKATQDLTTTAERMDATDLIRTFLADSSGALIQNTISDNSAPGGGGLWPVLHPTSDGTPYSAAVGIYQPLMYFKRIAVRTDGTLAIQANGNPCNNEYILYENTTTKEVRMRLLAYALPNAATCSGTNKDKTTCPVGGTSGTCIADKIILTKVSSIAISYFNRNGVQMIYDPANDTTTDMPDVEVANFTLSKWTLSNYDTDTLTTVTSSVRIALRNT